MAAIFETILRMSLAGSIAILAVLAARLALRKAPKKFSYLLWLVVLLRLLCPVGISVELPMAERPASAQIGQALERTPAAFFQSAEQAAAPVQAHNAATQNAAPAPIEAQNAPTQAPAQPAAPKPQSAGGATWGAILSYVWLAGFVSMGAYGAVPLVRLKRRLRTAVRLEESIYEADVQTPFVLGVIRPKIYLPANLDDRERAYIILHERRHIRSADPLLKLVAFFALMLHWFNPLVYVAFALFGRDMEMRCDEAVMARTEGNCRADYAQSLLNLSVGRGHLAAMPLAFGEQASKARIKNILRWKKPAALVGALAAVAVVVLAVLLALDPTGKRQEADGLPDARYRVTQCVYQLPTISMYFTPENAFRFMVTKDGRLFRSGPGAWDTASRDSARRGDICWEQIGWLEETAPPVETLEAMFEEFVAAWESAQTAQTMMQDVTDAWQIAPDEGRGMYILRSKKEGLLLVSYGEDRSGAPVAYYLWKLEAAGDAIPLARLEQTLREDAKSDNLCLFSCYEMENGLIVGAQDGGRMEFAIYEKKDGDYRKTAHVGLGNVGLASETIVTTGGLSGSVTVVMSSYQNLARVTAQAGGREMEAGVSACPAMVVFPWPEVLPEGTQAVVQYFDAADEALSLENEAQAQIDPPEEKPQPEDVFYELFWELDRQTMEDYLDEHPSVLDNGWDKIYINEAGFDDEGTSIRTAMGEQVLAIDAANKILLVRVEGEGYRGVLAVAKDPAQLSVEVSEGIGTYGQRTGEIAEAHGGVLAISANGFIDVDEQGNEGSGNGGLLADYAMSGGVEYGRHAGRGSKRIELHEDNRFYIKDASEPVGEGTTDAAEFQPALIVDGQTLYDSVWTGKSPRTCIGQSESGEILMLVIEGRMPLEGSIGTDVNTCADILARHNCWQAMNLDGGTSSMMWYDGEYVIRCSNESIRFDGGRPVPNAFVYKRIGD